MILVKLIFDKVVSSCLEICREKSKEYVMDEYISLIIKVKYHIENIGLQYKLYNRELKMLYGLLLKIEMIISEPEKHGITRIG